MKAVKGNSLAFWKGSAVYFRNKKDKAKTVEEFIDNMELLRTCREQVKRLERRILGTMHTRLLIMIVLVNILCLVMIVCSSCQTLKGGLGDSAWMLQKLSDNVKIEQEK
jgi:hypothetical protein